MNEQPPRWGSYVLLRQDDLPRFWATHLQERERAVLTIIGRGFDPRMCLGLGVVLGANGPGRRDVVAIEYKEGPASPSLLHQGQVNANWLELQRLLGNRGALTLMSLEFLSSDGRRITSQNSRDLFQNPALFSAYTDIVVDISAMPRSVFFPILARILYFLDADASLKTSPPKNLHVLVAEDPDLDVQIMEEGIEQNAEFMASFGGGFDEEGTQTPKIWIPLLGEHRRTQFERIYDLVKPDEVCPVLPSPSRNPRRSDNIVIEYRQLLFDELTLDPRDILYASELNPFEVYRQIRSTVRHYEAVFNLLAGCKVAISALSSKLMSLGALLVAYELKNLKHNIGVAHIECQGYVLPNQAPSPEVVGMWLTGECYA
jgi:hypothetical protein